MRGNTNLNGTPYTKDEMRYARSEVRRLLKELYSTDGLDVAELTTTGWARDPDRKAGGTVDSRAWAMVVASLELAVTAIEEANGVISDARYKIGRELEKFYRRDPSWFLTEPKADDE